MNVGIIGCGFVGGALKDWLEHNNPECKLFISDPPKGYNDDLSNVDIAFLQIHVPTEDDGTQDLRLMTELIKKLPDVPVFVRTTILPGTSDRLSRETGHQVCYMPEFLTERTHIPVLDEDNIVEFLVRKDVTLSDGEEEHLQMLFVLMEEMCQQLEITMRNRPERVAAYSSEFKQRINRVLLKVKAYNARLLPCMDKGKTVADLNGLFERWFSPSLDPTLRPNQEKLLKLLEDGYDKIKMEAYVHLLREASSLSLFKKAKPMSNKLYMALSTVKGVPDEEFPISGVSFNKYFRNPDFCKEAKWLEAAKVLTAVHQEFITGTQTFGH